MFSIRRKALSQDERFRTRLLNGQDSKERGSGVLASRSGLASEQAEFTQSRVVHSGFGVAALKSSNTSVRSRQPAPQRRCPSSTRYGHHDHQAGSAHRNTKSWPTSTARLGTSGSCHHSVASRHDSLTTVSVRRLRSTAFDTRQPAPAVTLGFQLGGSSLTRREQASSSTTSSLASSGWSSQAAPSTTATRGSTVMVTRHAHHRNSHDHSRRILRQNRLQLAAPTPSVAYVSRYEFCLSVLQQWRWLLH